MGFDSPVTIAETIKRMHAHELVLPAIQREFVWDQDQIVALFDSLMRGYPIGTFLAWDIPASRAGEFTYFDFVRTFHRRTGRHCPPLPTPGGDVTAILDGQQRLTSLNIGLAGSFAEKLPRLWKTNPHAYPTTHLYLDLTASVAEDELGLQYPFVFLTEEQAAANPSAFPVREVLGMSGLQGMMAWLAAHELGNDPVAPIRLARLYEVVHSERTVLFFRESDESIDRVLDIFIRVNSGGEPLSHSDLLLSIAVAQWRHRDARQLVHSLVDELNETHHGFGFSKDLVLKAGLVMIDASDIRFRVQNFNRANMLKLEDGWPEISQALRVAVRLLARFGLSDRTLPSNSGLIPLADWVHQHGYQDALVDAISFRDERQRIRSWVLRSLLKAGVFGSGLDTLLSAIRKAIRSADGPEFPVEQIEAAMAPYGKAPRFDDEELEDLVETSYGRGRAFVVLTTLFPTVTVVGDYHLDHIWPRSAFTPAQLRKHGVTDDANQELLISRRDLLPNLMLLQGADNESKGGRLPGEWLTESLPDADQRLAFAERHLLGEVTDDMNDFTDFYEARRGALLQRLQDQLKDGLAPAPHL